MIHGRYSSYTRGCRCALCRKANSVYKTGRVTQQRAELKALRAKLRKAK